MTTIALLRGIAQADDIAAQALAERAAGLQSAADQWAQAVADVAASTAEHARLSAALVTAQAQRDALTAERDAARAEAARLQAIIDAGVITPPPPPIDPPPVEPPVLTGAPGRYRYDQPLLFQPARAPYPSRIDGGLPFTKGSEWGPTHRLVDSGCGWPWDKPGGDWVDADGVRHGPKPWATWEQAAKPAPGDSLAAKLDITSMAQRPGWLAMLLRTERAAPAARSSQRGIVTQGLQRPIVLVRYTDGTTAKLPCITAAAISSGSTIPALHNATARLPVMLEFERPTKPVHSATLHLSVALGELSTYGGPAVIDCFPLDPPINRDPVEPGLAQDCPLDEGIADKPGVLVAQRYLPGTALHDYVHPVAPNFDDERTWSPRLHDDGAADDPTRLPGMGAGKIIGAHGNWSIVDAGHFAAAGLPALHQQLGALRVDMPHEASANGEVAGYDGSGYASAFIYLPIDMLARQRRLRVRHYMLWDYPGRSSTALTPDDRLQYYHLPADRTPQGEVRPTVWSDMGGKMGFSPAGNNTTVGGYSGSAGEGYGTQFRYSWKECTEALGGPCEGGIAPGWHLFDYHSLNIPGHVYANSTPDQAGWGQRGGLGGMLYARRWYCIETEVLLNDVDQPGIFPSGQLDNGSGRQRFWTPNGRLRTWIDGRLAFERSGMVFRALPLRDPGFRPGYSRPARQLGLMGVSLCVFHGGVAESPVHRALYLANLVCTDTDQPIGPMVLA